MQNDIHFSIPFKEGCFKVKFCGKASEIAGHHDGGRVHARWTGREWFVGLEVAYRKALLRLDTYSRRMTVAVREEDSHGA